MSQEPKPLIYIVDDDEAVRGALEFLMRSQGYKVASFDSAQSFLDGRDITSSAVAVFDIRMPGMSGLELFDRLIEEEHLLPVIFITGHGDVPMAVQAIKKGAVDFIQKPFDNNELLELISQASANLRLSHEKELQRSDALERIASLTERERQVMELVVEGNANKVIAFDLDVSQRTIEIHRSNVMQKMGCRSLAQLVKTVLFARAEV